MHIAAIRPFPTNQFRSHMQKLLRSSLSVNSKINPLFTLQTSQFRLYRSGEQGFSNNYQSRNSNNRFDDRRGDQRHSRDNRSRNDASSNLRKDAYIPEEVSEESLFDKKVQVESLEMYDNLPVDIDTADGSPGPEPVESVESDKIHDSIKRNLKRAGITRFTPVQKHALAILGAKIDLMACSQTGSGKTLAFLAPMMSGMIRDKQFGERVNISRLSSGVAPRGLIIAPTRELCNQIYEEARKFASGTPIFNVHAVYGGTSSGSQMSRLRNGCDILVGTPGRLKDFVQQGVVSLAKVEYLVLDEADRMLDMGFEPVMREIIQGHCKSDRTTSMFSATFPTEIQKLARDFLKDDFVFMSVGRVGSATDLITQNFVQTDRYDLEDKLTEAMDKYAGKKILIFTERKVDCEDLSDKLQQAKYSVCAIHGGRGQKERDWSIRSFKSGQTRIMIATDVASRGLDIGDIDVVINYKMPNSIDQYVHRIGRTGRAGKKGISLSFVSNADWPIKNDLINFLEAHKMAVPQFVYDLHNTLKKSPSQGRGVLRQPSRDFKPFTNSNFSGGSNGNYGSRQGNDYQRSNTQRSNQNNDFFDDVESDFSSQVNRGRK